MSRKWKNKKPGCQSNAVGTSRSSAGLSGRRWNKWQVNIGSKIDFIIMK